MKKNFRQFFPRLFVLLAMKRILFVGWPSALVKGLALAVLGVVAHGAVATEIDSSHYEVYYGDSNGDGKFGDVYFHGKDLFVLLHGDIAIPLLIKGPEGFVYFEDGDGTPQALDVDNAQLTAYDKAVENQDYFFGDVNADGYVDVVVNHTDGLGSFTIYGNGSGSAPNAIQNFLNPEITKTYRYDALGRLIEVHVNDEAKSEYNYDAAGNRTDVTDTQ